MLLILEHVAILLYCVVKKTICNVVKLFKPQILTLNKYEPVNVFMVDNKHIVFGHLSRLLKKN